ncbi:MAG: GntR family transcriptional regulator [Methylobacteriaceae bacterium]|jgi:DNA-binding GntR family transcriptional regulator|nr:GntR family transcriptional regulator [Methylobacteriaceae bacterium]
MFQLDSTRAEKLLAEESRRSADFSDIHPIVDVLPIRDQVADIIRRMILKGQLRPDEQVSERVISRILKISTTPVKEAFRILQAEGLIYVQPRVGSFVSHIPSDQIAQIAFMRASLEGVAAHFAASNCTREEIHTMSGCLGKVDALLKSENPGAESVTNEIASLNSTFHKILREASRNNYLINLILSLRSIDKTIRELSFEMGVGESVTAFREHSGILEAVKSNNGELAEQLMNQHIRRVARCVIDTQMGGVKHETGTTG